MSNQNKFKRAQSEWKGAVKKFYSDDRIISMETLKLDKLWIKALPMTDEDLFIIYQITSLSRCNWNLESSIKSIIKAVGKGKRGDLRIGHNYSITEDRWKKAWAYYFALKNWLPIKGRYNGLSVLLDYCDPTNSVQSHVVELLGKKSKLKQIYVELLCYRLEFLLMGRHPEDLIKVHATNAAINLLISEIQKLDYDEMILAAVQINPETFSDNKLSWHEICHHKFFRRLDITLSSINGNEWRGIYKEKSSDKEDLLDLFLRYSLALEAWISNQDKDDKFTKNIFALLDEHTNMKMFQVSLLTSFLKGQMEVLK